MDGFLQLSSDDLQTPQGVAKLNNMLQALFNTAPGDGVTVQDLSGYGSPEGVITASIGSTYRQVDGGAGTALYMKQSGTGNTGWVAIPSLPLSIANGGTGSATGNPYVKVSERQVSGTEGGGATTGSWQTRTLNTTDNDTGSISSLASNQVTLPAGTYICRAFAPFFNSGLTQLRLQNITDGGTLILGHSGINNASGSAGGASHISGQFTLAGSKALAIQYQCGTNTSTPHTLGYACSFGTEVYTVAEFVKVG